MQVVFEKEEDLAQRRQGEDRRIARIVNDDLKEQIRSLEEQFNVA